MLPRRTIITISLLISFLCSGCSTTVATQSLDDRIEVNFGVNTFAFATPTNMIAIDQSRLTELQSESRIVLSGKDFKLVGFFIEKEGEGGSTDKLLSDFLSSTSERHPTDPDILALAPRSVQIYLMDRGHWGYSKFDTLVKAYWKYKRDQWKRYSKSRPVSVVPYKREITQTRIRPIENSQHAKVAMFGLDNHITAGDVSFHHSTITAEGIINIDNTLFVIEVNSNHNAPEDIDRVVEISREILHSAGPN